MPATGTPVPGGFFFDEACDILRAVAEAGTIVGADIVELAPIAGLHACDFTAAKLAYKLLAYALLTRR
jgi:agmatinase